MTSYPWENNVQPWEWGPPTWVNDLYNKSSLDWLTKNTIYLTKHGSHAYGTATPLSDMDIRGIVVLPKKYYLGILDSFEQYQSMDPYDLTVFDIRKFCKLAMDANPNALEIIFTDFSDQIYRSPIFDKLFYIRDKFLSKKCKYSMAGYSQSQLRRIKTHRQWLLNPIHTKPERQDFGLPENKTLIPHHQLLEIDAAINKKISEWHLDTTGLDNDIAINIKNKTYDILTELKINSEEFDIYAARYLGLGDNLMEAFKKERQYKQAKRNYDNYLSWKTNRNPERAVLEEKYGFDCKHASQLYRLYVTCIDLLTTGKLIVKRPDAEQILAIKNGAWSFEQLMEWAKAQEEILNVLYDTCTVLPREPDRQTINKVCIEIIESMI